MTDAPQFQMLSVEHRKAPHATWDLLRTEDPVHYYRPLDCLLLTRYDDVLKMMRNTVLRIAPVAESLTRIASRVGEPVPHCEGFIRATLFTNTTAGHPTARRLVSATLNNRPLGSLAPVVTKVADELLAAGLSSGGFDAVTEFCNPLAFGVMSDIMGFGDSEAKFVFERAWQAPVLLSFVPDWRRARILEAPLAEACALIRDRLSHRRRSPRGDGLSRLVSMAGTASISDDAELAFYVLFMLFVGSATTAAFLAGAIMRLAGNDAVRNALRDPSRIAAAVEELLRLESTVSRSMPRIAAGGLEIAGVAIPDGRAVVPLIEAANRDSEVFEDPHEFRLDRKSPPNLVFGEGAHACLGGALARLEGRIALAAIAASPRLRVMTDDPELDSLDVLRRIVSLPVNFDAAATL